MKKIAMRSLAILLSVTPFVHAQQIANVLPKNNGGMFLPVVDTQGYFHTGPTGVRTTTYHLACRGTDVRSTSLRRTDRRSNDNIPFGMQGDSCEELLGEGNNLERDYYYTQAYDSMCYYLTHCTTQADPQTAFGVFNDATADTITTPQGCAAVKAFLLSILPLRTDDAWFCYCVSGFGLTFNLDTNQNREQLSLLKWLTDNPRCPMIHSEDSAGYVHERFIDYSLWLDTTHWPDTVYDSTLLTMQQMGLDSVLIISATEGVSPEAIGTQILLSTSILENPFQNSTSILLSIGREAYVTIQVFDILGHQIEGAGYASVFEQGNVTIPINMTNAPPGAYLVRISTANNEVQTLKLTKE